MRHLLVQFALFVTCWFCVYEHPDTFTGFCLGSCTAWVISSIVINNTSIRVKE